MGDFFKQWISLEFSKLEILVILQSQIWSLTTCHCINHLWGEIKPLSVNMVLTVNRRLFFTFRGKHDLLLRPQQLMHTEWVVIKRGIDSVFIALCFGQIKAQWWHDCSLYMKNKKDRTWYFKHIHTVCLNFITSKRNLEWILRYDLLKCSSKILVQHWTKPFTINALKLSADYKPQCCHWLY